MNTAIGEVLEFVKENDVKFVKLGFCDLFGFQKNISIMADELEDAFLNGVSFDAHSISGFRDVTQSDLFLFPDPSTLAVLPWRPGPGRVIRFYCDIKTPSGSLFSHDGRVVLKRVVKRAFNIGYTCKIGAECEFYLFKANENAEPTLETFDKGGYLDIAPLDKGEDVRREICLALEGMGIKPESSHHEQGPGQNEIDFRFDDALVSADNFLSFKSTVKAIAARNGLFASFLPKPLLDAPGNGLHINISLVKNGQNIFEDAGKGKLIPADNFIAGVLANTPDITLFLNPVASSYQRLGSFDAPKYVSWSHQNRSQLVRIPAASGEKARMELRSPDPCLNPYFAFALIIAAGLDGLENKTPLPPAVDADLNTECKKSQYDLALLPGSMEKAIHLAEESKLIKSVIGDDLLARYLEAKKAEAMDFSRAEDKQRFVRERYFNIL